MGNKFEDKRDIEIVERAIKVRSMRLAGLTYLQISKKIGISIDTVRRDLERIKVDFPERTARELVALQNDKLEAMMTPQFLRAAAGDGKAADIMVKLLKHQSDLFNLPEVKHEGESNAAVDALNKFFGLIRGVDTSDDAGK